MRTKSIIWIFVAAAGALGTSLLAGAQDTPPAPQTTAPAKQEAQPAAKKARKTWTDDDVATLRSPADVYAEQKEAQAADAARQAKADAAAKQAAAAKPAKQAGPRDALANPKTTDDADKMIAWEDRDIAAIQASIESLQKQVTEAPLGDKERLQKLLDQQIQALEETRKERQALTEKKKAFENPPAAGANAATPTPPSQ